MDLENNTLIKDLDFRHGAVFSGKYRIRNPRQKVASTGVAYLACDIEDAFGRLKAYAWAPKNSIEVAELDRVQLKGKIRELDNSFVVTVLHIEKLDSSCSNPLYLIPQSICPLPSFLEQLIVVVEGIRHDALRQFVFSVLADDSIALPFVRIPASRNHHHCISGGLLEHSLECAIMASRFAKLDNDLAGLAVVGALFHDIGKTRTVRSTGKLSEIGYVIDHDSLTLEVLSPYLRFLDNACPDAAIALRYVWTWRNRKKALPNPITTIAEIVAAADRISTGLNVEEEAFRDEPEWKNFVKFKEKNMCWRPIMTKLYNDRSV